MPTTFHSDPFTIAIDTDKSIAVQIPGLAHGCQYFITDISLVSDDSARIKFRCSGGDDHTGLMLINDDYDAVGMETPWIASVKRDTNNGTKGMLLLDVEEDPGSSTKRVAGFISGCIKDCNT